MNQNSKSGGIVTESIAPQINGHASADPFSGPSEVWAAGTGVQDDREASEDASVAVPWLMVADRLGAEPGDEIAPHLDPRQWEAVRTFARRYGVRVVAPNEAVERDGTRFEELDHAPLPVALAAVVCADLEGITRSEVYDFIAESALYDISDPEPALAKLTQEAEVRKRERAQQYQALKGVEVAPGEVITIAPHGEYALSEVERVCGAQVADEARLAIEQCNRRAWSHP